LGMVKFKMRRAFLGLMQRKVVCVFVLMAVCTVFLGEFTSPAEGQGVLCSLTGTVVNAPSTAPAGQQLEIDVTVTATCPGGGFYLIKEELTDPITSQQFAKAQTYYTTGGPYTLANHLAAPSQTGTWTIQANIYVIDQMSGQPVAPQSQKVFSIDIVPYTPQTTIITSTSSSLTTSSTSSLSSTLATTSSTYATTTSALILPTNTTTEQGQSYTQYLIAVGLFALLIIAGIIAKKKQGKRERTRVYDMDGLSPNDPIRFLIISTPNVDVDNQDFCEISITENCARSLLPIRFRMHSHCNHSSTNSL